MSQAGVPVLQMRGIVKHFPGVVANAGVDFDLLPGEVHALLGENGAGKTTLMNILYGMYAPDAGEIWLRGRRVAIASPHAAIAVGVWAWCISTSCWSSPSPSPRTSCSARPRRASRSTDRRRIRRLRRRRFRRRRRVERLVTRSF